MKIKRFKFSFIASSQRRDILSIPRSEQVKSILFLFFSFIQKLTYRIQVVGIDHGFEVFSGVSARHPSIRAFTFTFLNSIFDKKKSF